MPDPSRLSRRARQIMEVIYARGEASATDVVGDLPDPPSRTTVRTIMRILEERGHLSHRMDGREFIYRPAISHAQVGRSALQTVLRSFFGDSLPKALAVYFSDPHVKLDAKEVRELKELINQAKKRGD